MSRMANLVRVLTSSTGTATMTLGAAYSQLFMTSAEAGMIDGETYSYLIVDANNWELGKGVYTASGTTLSRVTVKASRIAGTLGTSKITLSGTAQVRIVDSADDMGALRGTRAVTGTSDALAQNDLGGAVTYSNAAAIAVSLAQAFQDGWTTWVKNTGAGAVTITPATSTINGGATLVLAQNMGAFIWSDGTNYHAGFMPVTKPLLAANNLADVANAATARGNIGLPAIMRSYLAGLTLSTAGSSATFGIAAGVAIDSTNVDSMSLASAYTKTTSAWAVGTAAGSLDTSTIANSTWYHVHLIKRPDTGVVDVLISLSATAPTLPTNYTLFRRIGSLRTNGSAQWEKFSQRGDEFIWDIIFADVNATNPGTSAVTRTLTVPTGLQVIATINVLSIADSTTGENRLSIFSFDKTDEASANKTITIGGVNYSSTPAASQSAGQNTVRTNTSAQIKSKNVGSSTNTQLVISTTGWIDDRGKLN